MQISAQISQFHGIGTPFEVCEMPVHATSDNVLVAVSLSTICGSDLHTVSGRRGAETPCILGHEIIGTLVAPTRLQSATGDTLREGDRVTWSMTTACGTCDYCVNHNLPQKCETMFKYGHARNEGDASLSGGFATHILLRPGTAIYRIPDAVTDREAVPINCALTTVVNGLEVIGIQSGETAIIHGAGMLGIYAACYLRENGYKRVVVVDLNEERLAIAKRFGATHTFNPDKISVSEIGEALKELTDGRGADLGVEVSGATIGIPNLVTWLAIGGRCLTLGYVYPDAHISVDAHQLVTKCITLRGVHNYHWTALGTALKFIEESRERYQFGELIGKTYPLSEINTAFADAMDQEALRIAITPSL
ncbi:MAG: zinc-binding dehydrogenase [Candidatus Poribacteria bacterium]|nr:zinc-binding dehydrogenase [Candidatus Poribacteria bacterium]